MTSLIAKLSIPLASASLGILAACTDTPEAVEKHVPENTTELGQQFENVSPPKVFVTFPIVNESLLPAGADYESYASNLMIDAQAAPYNLDDNVLMITRSDMANIGDSVRAKMEEYTAYHMLHPFLSEFQGLSDAIEEQGAGAVFNMEELEASRDDLIEAYVLEHQAGFIRYAYERVGYGAENQSTAELFKSFFDLTEVEQLSEAEQNHLRAHGLEQDDLELLAIMKSFIPMFAQTLPPEDRDKLKSLDFTEMPADFLENFKLVSQQMAEQFNLMVEEGNEMALQSMVGETLLALETRSYMMSPGASGGIVEMLQPNFFENRTNIDGSVLVADDGTQSDGQFMQTALSFDPNSMHPDFYRIAYLDDFINQHEAGHHVMGGREELAEQYGALKYLQEQPENEGALMMMRDFRNLNFLVSDTPLTVTLYGDTAKSLNTVIGMQQDNIASLSPSALIEMSKSGHGPNVPSQALFKIDPELLTDPSALSNPMDSMINVDAINQQFKPLAGAQDIIALRVKLFQEYQNIEDGTDIPNPSTIASYYLNSNAFILPVTEYWSRADASFEGFFEFVQQEGLASQMPDINNIDFVADLDPALLSQAVISLKGQYSTQSSEYSLLEYAEIALNNFSDPVNAYGLKPNFEPNPPSEELVIGIGYNPFLQEVEYDAFRDVRRDLEMLNYRYEPREDAPIPDHYTVDRPFATGTEDALEALRNDQMGDDYSTPNEVEPMRGGAGGFNTHDEHKEVSPELQPG